MTLFLQEYQELWEENPKSAAPQWFRNARYGLFLHYGLYSLLHEREWAQFYQKIPVGEYEKLKEQFTAHRFDAEYLTDLAIRAGVKYIMLTAYHHESFYLFDSKTEPFNRVNSPCNRDLVRELSEACKRKGLGFFVYHHPSS